MRNLKKILALVLALVMSLSLMATAGATDTTADADAATQYATASKVLVGLDVVKGDLENPNDYRLNDSIIRAEAAALIYRVHTADVDDKQAALHYEGNVFSDLAPVQSWAMGYISYAHNAEIVKGNGDGTFNPLGEITGYETLAMTLRALGYGKNGEFEGDNWMINTATWAQREKLLDGVSPSDQVRLDKPASRGMVFQIMFNAIQHDNVGFSYTTTDLYASLGTTMAEALGLTKVEGVVMANEYANLEGASVLPAGKTKLDQYTIDESTGFDDIGERKLAYLRDGKTVLDIADSSKNTREFTLDEMDLDDLLGKAGISGSNAEHFINFDPIDEWTTPYRIRYVLKVETSATDSQKYLVGHKDESNYLAQDVADAIDNAADSDAVVSYTEATSEEISVVLKPGSKVGSLDRSWMEYIFANGDLNHAATPTDPDEYDVGEIYINTQSTKDISDDKDYYYEKFEEEFLRHNENVKSISENENGNWLKVIDNDGDKKADYVLKVIYTGAQVERVKDGAVTLDVKNHALVGHDRIGAEDPDDSAVNTLTNQKVVTMTNGDLEKGDVVYYAIIDKVARVYKADMITATIDKINRNEKSTTTMDGDTFYESGVCDHILNSEFADQVTDLTGNVKFDLYFDRGGYLLTFIKSNASGDFKLITDGWFRSTRDGLEYAARVYNDAEEKQEIVDLTSGGSKFIGRDVVYVDSKGVTHTTDNNDWNALKYFGKTNDISSDTSALDNNMLYSSNTYNPNRLKNTTVAPAALNGGYKTGDDVLNNVIKTTVASIDEEGNILPVENYAITGRYQHLMIELPDDKIPSSSATTGHAYITVGDTAYDAYYDDSTGLSTSTYSNAEVELRALNNTIYYVVWPTSSGVSVKSFTGYGSVSDIVKLASVRGSTGLEYVEDIYAVGTQTVSENKHGEDQRDYYYTADIVVIELNQAPTSARDIVLLVDDEGQVDRTGHRHVLVIQPDGSRKWIEITNGPSAQLLSNNNEKKLQPGLYFRASAGDDLYSLEWMTPEDILAAECFITGQVQDVYKTSSKDYVIVNPADTDTIADGDEDGILVDDATANTVQPVITENSLFYTLAYDGGNAAWYKENPANLSEEGAEDYETVLRSFVEDINKGSAGSPADGREAYSPRNGSYFFNDVLIRYNDKNEIVWAVSFKNAYKANGAADYAQTVWANVVPAAETEETPDPDLYTVTLKYYEDTTPIATRIPDKTISMVPNQNLNIAVEDYTPAGSGYQVSDVKILDASGVTGDDVSGGGANPFTIVAADAIRNITINVNCAKVTCSLTATIDGGSATGVTPANDIEYSINGAAPATKDLPGTAAAEYGNTFKITITTPANYTYETKDPTDVQITKCEAGDTDGTQWVIEGVIKGAANFKIKQVTKPTTSVTFNYGAGVSGITTTVKKADNGAMTTTNGTANAVVRGTDIVFTPNADVSNAIDKVTYSIGGQKAQDAEKLEDGKYSVPGLAEDDPRTVVIYVTTVSTADNTVTLTNNTSNSAAILVTSANGEEAVTTYTPVASMSGDKVKFKYNVSGTIVFQSDKPVTMSTNSSAEAKNPSGDYLNWTVSGITADTEITIADADLGDLTIAVDKNTGAVTFTETITGSLVYCVVDGDPDSDVDNVTLAMTKDEAAETLSATLTSISASQFKLTNDDSGKYLVVVELNEGGCVKAIGASGPLDIEIK